MLDLARFSTVTNTAALEDREHRELAAQKLRAGEMPPKGLPRPPADKVAAVIEWVAGRRRLRSDCGSRYNWRGGTAARLS
jgi:hypothetical protein